MARLFDHTEQPVGLYFGLMGDVITVWPWGTETESMRCVVERDNYGQLVLYTGVYIHKDGSIHDEPEDN